MIQITYQKRNGCIIQRFRNTLLSYKIGDTTSMGWKVLNIEYKYKNKYYPEHKYHMLIYQKKQKNIKKRHIKNMLFKEIKTLLYNIIIIMILYYIKILIL